MVVMANVSYNRKSPYALTSQTSWYLDFYTPRIIEAFDDDTLFKVATPYHYRPDKLSYDLYGTTNLWWVFAARNMDLIQDPIWDFVAGLVIYIPSKSYIDRI
jgi:hypothetical protein